VARTSEAIVAGDAARDAEPERQDETLPQIGRLPRHVAIIMDGNGRWAQQRGLSRQAGHRAGTENIRRVIERFAEYGVECLTLYAFSTENWKRSRAEVEGLIRILGRVINREIGHFHENGIQLRHLGRLDRLPVRLQKQVQDAIELTKNNTRMTLCVAFNYGSRTEITQAIQQIVRDGLAPDEIDEQTVERYLYTTGLPDPDLIVRTGGEMRLSNFLLWQAAYAEFYATETYWPDFGRDEIDRALLAFAARDRRFGGVPTNGGPRQERRRRHEA
jgi:undecaprenyl diphosphate synthase